MLRPRSPVADPVLQRPDWTRSGSRDERLLWLDKNENLDPTLRAWNGRILAEVGPRALASYPDCAPLYHKLARHVGVDVSCLLLAHGSDGVIRAAFEAFVDPGDAVLFPDPTFKMYAVYSAMYGARAVPVQYDSTQEGPYLNVERLVGVIQREGPKLVCVPNPDSPTGSVMPRAGLTQVIEAAAAENAVVLIDEAYYPFYPETIVDWTKRHSHLVVARTFAKAWGLAGLRIGYGVADVALTRLLHKVRPMYEVSTLAAAVMDRALDSPGEMFASVRRLNEGRDQFLDAMDDLGLATIRARGNFAHVAFGPWRDVVAAALRDLVLYREFDTLPLAGYSRFSATTPELFAPVIERIRAVVTDLKQVHA